MVKCIIFQHFLVFHVKFIINIQIRYEFKKKKEKKEKQTFVFLYTPRNLRISFEFFIYQLNSKNFFNFFFLCLLQMISFSLMKHFYKIPLITILRVEVGFYQPYVSVQYYYYSFVIRT